METDNEDFSVYLESPDARLAEHWQLKTLQRMRLSLDRPVSQRTYEGWRKDLVETAAELTAANESTTQTPAE